MCGIRWPSSISVRSVAQLPAGSLWLFCPAVQGRWILRMFGSRSSPAVVREAVAATMAWCFVLRAPILHLISSPRLHVFVGRIIWTEPSDSEDLVCMIAVYGFISSLILLDLECWYSFSSRLMCLQIYHERSLTCVSPSPPGRESVHSYLRRANEISPATFFSGSNASQSRKHGDQQ